MTKSQSPDPRSTLTGTFTGGQMPRPVSPHVGAAPVFPKELLTGHEASVCLRMLSNTNARHAVSNPGIFSAFGLQERQAPSFIPSETVDATFAESVLASKGTAEFSRWYIREVPEMYHEAMITQSLLNSVLLSDSLLDVASCMISSVTKYYSTPTKCHYYIVLRTSRPLLLEPKVVMCGTLVRSATPVQTILGCIPHVTQIPEIPEDVLTPIKRLTPLEMLLGYFFEQLCLGCDSIGHTQPSCPSGCESVCGNCHSLVHHSTQCPRFCRFCEGVHHGRSIVQCIRSVAVYHKTRGRHEYLVHELRTRNLRRELGNEGYWALEVSGVPKLATNESVVKIMTRALKGKVQMFGKIYSAILEESNGSRLLDMPCQNSMEVLLEMGTVDHMGLKFKITASPMIRSA